MARIKDGKKCDVSHFEGEQREKTRIRCVAQHDRAGQVGRGLSAWSSCDSLMELHGTQRRLDFDNSLGCCWQIRSFAALNVKRREVALGLLGIGGGLLQVR
jgi:hypothetical protein